MLQYNLRGALNDFKLFNNLQIDEKNVYLNLNFTPQNGSIYSFKISTKFTHYILIDNTLHSLYENEFDLRRAVEDLKLPRERIYYGHVPEGAVLSISTRYQRAIFTQLSKLAKTVFNSFNYYTNQICDIGCAVEDDDDEFNSSSSSSCSSIFYKKISHDDDIKLVKLSSTIGVMTPASFSPEKNTSLWTMASDNDWKSLESSSASGAVIYEFSWIILGETYWAMSSRTGGGDISVFKEGIHDRLV